MEVQTDITKQDVVDFNLYHMSRSPTLKRQYRNYILGGIVWVVFWIAVWFVSGDAGRMLVILLPAIMGGVTFVLVYVVIILVNWRWGFKRQIHKYLAEGENKGVFGPQRVIISSDGVADISEMSQTTTHWKAVERVVASEDCLYIYTSAMSAVIVPKRFFLGEAAFEEFVKTAKEYHAQATS